MTRSALLHEFFVSPRKLPDAKHLARVSIEDILHTLTSFGNRAGAKHTVVP